MPLPWHILCWTTKQLPQPSKPVSCPVAGRAQKLLLDGVVQVDKFAGGDHTYAAVTTLQEKLERMHTFEQVYPFSVHKGTGMEPLRTDLLSRHVPTWLSNSKDCLSRHMPIWLSNLKGCRIHSHPATLTVAAARLLPPLAHAHAGHTPGLYCKHAVMLNGAHNACEHLR